MTINDIHEGDRVIHYRYGAGRVLSTHPQVGSEMVTAATAFVLGPRDMAKVKFDAKPDETALVQCDTLDSAT